MGWLKTVDQYATGLNNTIQHANTGLTIDTVLSNLLENPDHTFSYVEQAFFQRWSESASPQQLEDMQRMVASGQMTFINGAWSMSDEASPSYIDMIDNIALGHRLIKEQYGIFAIPTLTWQIDPFGHSAAQASVMSSPICGFSALYFGRMDFQDRAARQNRSDLEMIWRASASTGVNTQVFTGAMPGYGPPDARLCWDEVGCSNTQPIQDDPALEDYNVDEIVDIAVGVAQTWYSWHKQDASNTTHLLWTMGSDFQYTNSRSWFKNLDKLVHYGNLGTATHKVNFLYSDPATYTNLKLAQDIPWSLKTDDFMPYFDGPHAVWSGYFVSRSALKHYVRSTSAVHQMARQQQFFAARPADTGPTNPLFRLERAMGVTQHHDGVSGTSKQHVAYDYARRLAWGREDAAAAASAALNVVLRTNTSWATCDLANATICPALEASVAASAPVLVSAWNARSQALAQAQIRIPVSTPPGIASFAVADSAGAAVPAQLLPASPADAALRTAYYGAAPLNASWLVFLAPLPAAGFAVFKITPSATAAGAPATHLSHPRRVPAAAAAAAPVSITNGVVTLAFDAASGLPASYASAALGASPIPLAQSWGWYNSSQGWDAPNDQTSDYQQASGAYIFRPNASTFLPITAQAVPAVVVLTGPIVSEVRTDVSAGEGWLTQATRLWQGQAWAEIEYTVGPIPNGPHGTGKEVVTRFTAPSLVTAANFSTDSNCREMVPRTRNVRYSWNYTVYEPVAGNYAPVNCRITTRDTAASGAVLSVTTDRSQGGASMLDGSIELMVQRRLQTDDRRGVGEPLNEPGLNANGAGLVIRGVHRLALDAPGAAAANGKEGVQAMLFPPQLSYAAVPRAMTGGVFSGLAAPLPPAIHLLTVHAHSPSTLLLRLAHLYEVGEDAVLSAPVTVALSNLFAGSTLSACEEVRVCGGGASVAPAGRFLLFARSTLTPILSPPPPLSFCAPFPLQMSTPGAKPLTSVSTHTVEIVGEGKVTWPTFPAAPVGVNQTVTIAAMEIRTWLCTAS